MTIPVSVAVSGSDSRYELSFHGGGGPSARSLCFNCHRYRGGEPDRAGSLASPRGRARRTLLLLCFHSNKDCRNGAAVWRWLHLRRTATGFVAPKLTPTDSTLAPPLRDVDHSLLGVPSAEFGPLGIIFNAVCSLYDGMMHPGWPHFLVLTFTIPSLACWAQNSGFSVPLTPYDGRLVHPWCPHLLLVTSTIPSLAC